MPPEFLREAGQGFRLRTDLPRQAFLPAQVEKVRHAKLLPEPREWLEVLGEPAEIAGALVGLSELAVLVALEELASPAVRFLPAFSLEYCNLDN